MHGDLDRGVTQPRPELRSAPTFTLVPFTYCTGMRSIGARGQEDNVTALFWFLTNPCLASVLRAFSKSACLTEAISHHQEGSREVLNGGLEQAHLLINHSSEGWRPSQAVLSRPHCPLPMPASLTLARETPENNVTAFSRS